MTAEGRDFVVFIQVRTATNGVERALLNHSSKVLRKLLKKEENLLTVSIFPCDSIE